MSKTRPARPRSSATFVSAPGPLRAEVLDLSGDDAVLVRLHRATPEEVIRAELAVPHYEPTAGDRVLVTHGEEGWFVLGVLGAARRRPLTHLGPGLTATYREGAGVELRVAEGDLTLAAPGRVTLRADAEVETVSPAVRIEATSMLVSAGRHELCAARVVERAGDVPLPGPCARGRLTRCLPARPPAPRFFSRAAPRLPHRALPPATSL